MNIYHLGINESLMIHGTRVNSGKKIAVLVIGKRCDYPDLLKQTDKNDKLFFANKNVTKIVFHKIESIDLMIKELQILKDNLKKKNSPWQKTLKSS